MLKTRSRLINFRVTEEEFDRLKSASAGCGARCLSDFARSVMLQTADDAGAPQVEDRLAAIEDRLANLESGVARVLSATEAELPPVRRATAH